MKKLWIGSGMVVAVCLLAIILSYALRGDPAPLRVSTYETALSPYASSMPFVVVNLTDTETGFFQSYELQYERDGSWKTLPQTSGDGQELRVGAKDYQTVTLDLQPFGTLANGRYRLVLRDTNGRKYYSNVFTLEDVAAVDGVPEESWGEAVQGGVYPPAVPSADDLRDQLSVSFLRAEVVENGGYGAVRLSLDAPESLGQQEVLAEVGIQRYDPDGDLWVANVGLRQDISLSAYQEPVFLRLAGDERSGRYRAYLFVSSVDRILYSNEFTL